MRNPTTDRLIPSHHQHRYRRFSIREVRTSLCLSLLQRTPMPL